MTISSAFPVDVAAAEVPAPPSAEGQRARAHARMRAREYPSPSVMVNTLVGWGRQAGADLRGAWFMPASLPTFQTAWTERMPDRERVPGDNGALYAGWIAYNHSVGLLIPAVALAVVGLLTAVLWIARHPARLLLAAVITTALIALTFG